MIKKYKQKKLFNKVIPVPFIGLVGAFTNTLVFANANAKFSCGVSIGSSSACNNSINTASNQDLLSTLLPYLTVGIISLVIAGAVIFLIVKAFGRKSKKK